MEVADYRTLYDKDDSLRNKFVKVMMEKLSNKHFRAAREFDLRLWIDITADQNCIELSYAVGKNTFKKDSTIFKKIHIFEDGDNNQMLQIHAAQRLGLYMDDQIVSITAPRILEVIEEFVDEFTSFRRRNPEDETRNV